MFYLCNFIFTCSCLSMAFNFLKVSPIILQSKSYSSACSSWYWKFIRDWSASTKFKCLITHETTISSITSGWITSLGLLVKPSWLSKNNEQNSTIYICNLLDIAFTNRYLQHIKWYHQADIEQMTTYFILGLNWGRARPEISLSFIMIPGGSLILGRSK